MAESRQDFPDDVNTVPAEDGSTWVEIASTGTEDEATLLHGFLEAEGIAAQIENVKFENAPINFGAMGDIRVYVQAQDEQRAQELLRSRNRQAEQLDDDDETLVTDEGPAIVDENSQAESDDGASNT
jgi:formate dehydrogenase assembly factor FdhD